MNANSSLAAGYYLRAKSDVSSAGILYRAQSEDVANNICFHSHQAAEKILKSFLCHQGAKISRTHDLTLLIAQCVKHEPAFSDLELECDRLNDYAVEARYPDDFIQYTLEDASEALKMLQRIWDFVVPRLGFDAALWTSIF